VDNGAEFCSRAIDAWAYLSIKNGDTRPAATPAKTTDPESKAIGSLKRGIAWKIGMNVARAAPEAAKITPATYMVENTSWLPVSENAFM
jgi:hypothetical protein